MKTTALIMAGGHGERFWPMSRKNLPKQFLSLTNDGKTLIQLSVERIAPLVAPEDIYISTNKNYLTLVREQLPEVPEENIICEPVRRNTAPCIGFGAAKISKKHGDAIMIVLPSDHLVKNNNMFINALSDATELAEALDALVTVGITPDHPETGYGYVKFNSSVREKNGYRVEHFAEKPDFETAKSYLASGEYLWNSGMFVWKTDSILKCFERIMPDVYESLMVIKDAVGTSAEADVVEKLYPTFPSISIDYGIMEKADNIHTIPGAFGWDDVGSWNAMERTFQTNDAGNIVNGNIITIDTNDCIIRGGQKLIACVGLKDLVVVDSDDATLICAKDSTQDIKKVLDNLKVCNRTEYL